MTRLYGVKTKIKLWLIQHGFKKVLNFIMYVKRLLRKPCKNDISYDVMINWAVTDCCNLACAYCHVPKTSKASPIDIPALIKTLDATNKVFLIAMSGGGGEPFMVPNIVEACKELTKKHYLTIFTNLTSDKVGEFANSIDPKRVLHVKASLHLKELERLNLLDIYIKNFLLFKAKGFNISAIEVAHPSLLKDLEKYKKLFKDHGIEISFNTLRPDTYDGKEYPQAYTKKELKAFGLNKRSVNEACFPKGIICNAGYNVAVAYPSGEVNPCFHIKESMGNMYTKIEFRNRLIKCPFTSCICRLSANTYFFDKAIEECNEII